MNANEVSILVNVVLTVAVVIVGFIFKNLISSQEKKIKNLESIVNTVHKFTEIIDIDKVHKFVKNERLLMAQELELLKRSTVEKASKETAEYFSKNFDKRVNETTSRLLNDLSVFAYWFLDTHIEEGDDIEVKAKMIFPNIHEELVGYFKFIDSKNENLDKKKQASGKPKNHDS